MKNHSKNILMIFIILSITMLITACSTTTRTQEDSTYVFDIGETAEIIEIQTGDTLAELTIESCELVSDEPFVIREKDNYDESGKKYIETEYSALYKVTFDYDATGSSEIGRFFSSDYAFEINPIGQRTNRNSFYIGAKKGNGEQKCVTIAYYHDEYQDRPTASFLILLDKTVPYTAKRGKVIRTDLLGTIRGTSDFVVFALLAGAKVASSIIIIWVVVMLIVDIFRFFSKKSRKIRQLTAEEATLKNILEKARVTVMDETDKSTVISKAEEEES